MTTHFHLFVWLKDSLLLYIDVGEITSAECSRVNLVDQLTFVTPQFKRVIMYRSMKTQGKIKPRAETREPPAHRIDQSEYVYDVHRVEYTVEGRKSVDARDRYVSRSINPLTYVRACMHA
jgi:hypothetical protein